MGGHPYVIVELHLGSPFLYEVQYWYIFGPEITYGYLFHVI